MKNQMILGKNDNWHGQTISNIKEWARSTDEAAKGFKSLKKEITLWNKLAKQMHQTNPNLTSNWIKIKADTGGSNHINSFVIRVFLQLKDKRFTLDQIGKIDVIDDGSRGLAKTYQMHLLDINGNILDVSTEYMNRFYYM